MTKRMLIDALHPEEIRVAIADNSQIFEFDFSTVSKQQLKGNVYLAKITRVEPSLQAAFVEYGGGKQGFLPFSEIHPDYYQIPVSDRKRLIEEVERENALLDADDDDAPEENAEGGIVGATLAAADMPQASEPGGEEAISVPLEFTVPLSADSEMSDAAQDVSAEEIPPSPEDRAPAPQAARAADDSVSAPAVMEEEAPQEGGYDTLMENAAEGESVEGGEEQAGEPQEGAQASEGRPARRSRRRRGGQAAQAPAATGEENGSEGVETLASEEEEMSGRTKRTPFFKRYRIQEVIKRGQIVLVQVIKEERGNKGVSLTTYLSLAGRYSVLMPNSPRDGGVSRKINDSETRKRLKAVMAELKLARGMSVIIRTAGIDRTRTEIKRDFDYLVKLWNQIRDNTLAATAPALIYEEGDLIKRSIRDQYTNDIDEVLVEGEDAYKSARDFMKMLLPSHTPRVKLYRESTPLFYAYGIEEQLLSMHDPVVKLRSGGYIVINPTEALISIDVNSGRATGERNIEETASKTNLEAAQEIARQLRLRDLAGLIVIDFIDMMESRNRRNVERQLKDALKADRAKIQLGRISPFGLLEMSRQRLRPSISEASTVQCPHCVGRGVIRSHESLSLQIIRSLEKDASTGNWQSLKLTTCEWAGLYLLNHKRALISSIEERYGVQITVFIDHDMMGAQFTIERTRRAGGSRYEERRDNEGRRTRGGQRQQPRARQPVEEPEAQDITETEETPAEEAAESAEPRERNPRRRRRGRRGGQRENGALADTAETEEAAAEGVDALEGAGEAAEDSASAEPVRSRGSRGRGRNRRRWREEGEGASAEESAASESAAPQPAREPAVQSFEPSAQSFAPAAAQAEVAYAVPSSAAALPTTKRPEGEAPRKGWWQRMIELE